MGCTWAKVVEELALFFKDGLTNGAHKLVHHDTSPFTIPTRSPNLPRCDEGKWRWRDPSGRQRRPSSRFPRHSLTQTKNPGDQPRVFHLWGLSRKADPFVDRAITLALSASFENGKRRI